MKIEYKKAVVEDVEVNVDWEAEGCLVLDRDKVIAVTESQLDALILVEGLKQRWDNLPWSYIRINGEANCDEDDLR